VQVTPFAVRALSPAGEAAEWRPRAGRVSLARLAAPPDAPRAGAGEWLQGQSMPATVVVAAIGAALVLLEVREGAAGPLAVAEAARVELDAQPSALAIDVGPAAESILARPAPSARAARGRACVRPEAGR
jgi:hypothetical protein